MYLRLCDGDASALVPHPSIDAFYAELTARHAEIDTIPEEKIDDHDYCPWSCKLDYSSTYVIMCCVWSKASYVHELVQAVARKHGLALYDPQSERVTYPDGSTGGSAKTGMSRSVAWVLGSFALLFCRDIRLLGKDGALQSPLDNLPLRWFMCADGRGVLSAGVEIVPVSCHGPKCA